jgi:hypothetical protein
VRDAIDLGVGVAYRQLLYEAAQGSLMHNDDTHMRILELTVKLNHGEPLRDDQPDRRGVFTTNILSMSADRPTISLFFTGPRHSGENLRELLAKRMADLPAPIQMCDALSRNMPGDLQTILANCLSHGRRNFYELADVFPSEVRHVLEIFKQVYKIDAKAKMQELSPGDRLRLHQQESRPLMDELRRWLDEQFDERKAEPNSSMGKAIAYMRKHWEKLTLFLRVAGAPLGRVERWRGGLGFGLHPCQGFPVRGAIAACHAPFPHSRSSNRTCGATASGSLTQLRPSHSAWSDVRAAETAQACRIGSGRDTVCIPCRFSVHAASSTCGSVAPCTGEQAHRLVAPGLG